MDGSLTAYETTKREWQEALRHDEEDLRKIRKDIKTLQRGGEVENLTLENALVIEKGLEQVIQNKKNTIRKLAAETPVDTSLSLRVAHRFMMLSDNRYRPPRQILQGVDAGHLDPKVLLVWKYVVEKLGPKFNYGAATAYWRNKCQKQGLDLPTEYQQAGAGATFGHFKIKSGDQIEEWVKEQLRTAGLIGDVTKSASEWELEIEHLQASVDDAKERIAKHEKGIAEGKRVKQREKWLAQARKDLESSSKDLDAAKKAVEGLKETVDKHEDVKAPVIDFERQFQAALHSASNDLSRKEVLAQARRALAKFEEAMAAPKFAADKQADLLERAWMAMQRAWRWVKNAFREIAEWSKDLVSSTKQIQKVLSAV